MNEEEILSEADKQRQHELKMEKLRIKEREDRRAVRVGILVGVAVVLVLLFCGACNAYMSDQCVDIGGSYDGLFACER